MKNNRGFTLIEILASITILGLLLTAFFQFFIFSQKTTTSNQEKLVALDIAQSVFEQIKKNAYPEVTSVDIDADDDYPKVYNFETVCSIGDEDTVNQCAKRYTISSNNKTFHIKIIVDKKLDVGILSVEVQVCNANGNIKSKVKGFVEI